MKKKVFTLLKKYDLELPLVYIYFNVIKYLPFKNIRFNDKDFTKIKYTKGSDMYYSGIPRVIWIFWANPLLPDDINICVSRIKELNPNYVINVLNEITIKDFIDIDLDRKDMPLANISDLIRLKLLEKYGGVWLDASIVINKPIDWFIDKECNNVDLIAFHRQVISVKSDFPVIESWFLAAPKDSRYIAKWLKNFELVESIGSKSYFEIIEKRLDYMEIKQKINPPEYLIVYLANQITMKEIKSCNLILYLSDKSAYLLQDTLGWRAYKTHAYLTILDAPDYVSPIYKLTSGDRKYMEMIFNKSLINPKSIIGKIM